jgi:hypothetical protein
VAVTSHRNRSHSARTRGFQIRCFVFSATLKEYPAARAASLSLSPTSFSKMNVRCRRVSPFRRSDLLALNNSCMFACSEAQVPSDSESRKAGCWIAVSSDGFIRLPSVLSLFREFSATLAFVNSFHPTYSWLPDIAFFLLPSARIVLYCAESFALRERRRENAGIPRLRAIGACRSILHF